MQIQYFVAASVDGFIATENDLLDWLFPLAELDRTGYPGFIAGVGALVMGSHTYEWMLRNADQVAASTGAAWPYSQPAWIFSSRPLPPIGRADLRFVSGNVAPFHADMRAAAGDRNVWIVGGGDLAGQFYDAGLLDQMIIQVGSVTLGTGKPVLPRRILSPALRLVSVLRVGPGMAELHYDVEKP